MRFYMLVYKKIYFFLYKYIMADEAAADAGLAEFRLLTNLSLTDFKTPEFDSSSEDEDKYANQAVITNQTARDEPKKIQDYNPHEFNEALSEFEQRLQKATDEARASAASEGAQAAPTVDEVQAATAVDEAQAVPPVDEAQAVPAVAEAQAVPDIVIKIEEGYDFVRSKIGDVYLKKGKDITQEDIKEILQTELTDKGILKRILNILHDRFESDQDLQFLSTKETFSEKNKRRSIQKIAKLTFDHLIQRGDVTLYQQRAKNMDVCYFSNLFDDTDVIKKIIERCHGEETVNLWPSVCTPLYRRVVYPSNPTIRILSHVFYKFCTDSSYRQVKPIGRKSENYILDGLKHFLSLKISYIPVEFPINEQLPNFKQNCLLVFFASKKSEFINALHANYQDKTVFKQMYDTIVTMVGPDLHGYNKKLVDDLYPPFLIELVFKIFIFPDFVTEDNGKNSEIPWEKIRSNFLFDICMVFKESVFMRDFMCIVHPEFIYDFDTGQQISSYTYGNISQKTIICCIIPLFGPNNIFYSATVLNTPILKKAVQSLLKSICPLAMKELKLTVDSKNNKFHFDVYLYQAKKFFINTRDQISYVEPTEVKYKNIRR